MLPIGSHGRRVMATAVAALTVAAGVSTYDSPVHAAAPVEIAQVEVAANALKPAIRLSQVPPAPSTPTGVLTFPMNPLPKCAMSKTSFGQPRGGGRFHEGIDIMAGLGQEVYAADNGVMWRQTIDGTPSSTLSGNAWYLKLSDGTYYFYAHLSKFADGLAVGATVARGQLIGYVGDTGNAGPGNYHLHFEVHPKGGAAVNPFPLLAVPKSCQVVP